MVAMSENVDEPGIVTTVAVPVADNRHIAGAPIVN
jgi:hypothetical protein